MKTKVYLLSLGCAKNAVDSETILSFFKRNGFNIVLSPRKADVIVINKCGFIILNSRGKNEKISFRSMPGRYHAADSS